MRLKRLALGTALVLAVAASVLAAVGTGNLAGGHTATFTPNALAEFTLPSDAKFHTIYINVSAKPQTVLLGLGNGDVNFEVFPLRIPVPADINAAEGRVYDTHDLNHCVQITVPKASQLCAGRAEAAQANPIIVKILQVN